MSERSTAAAGSAAPRPDRGAAPRPVLGAVPLVGVGLGSRGVPSRRTPGALSFGRLVAAEARKLLGLPLTWAGVVIALVMPSAVLVLGRLLGAFVGASAGDDGPNPDAGFAELTIGVVGVGLVAVQVIVPEYAIDRRAESPGRQITATLAAAPNRTAVLAAKVLVLAVACVALAALAVPAALVLSHAFHGAPVWDGGAIVGRAAAVALYWLLTALLVFAGSLLLRSGIVPVTLLILNNSLVSLTLLLHFVTPLADALPDLAGMRMYLDLDWVGLPYGPVGGGLIMAAWALGGLGAAAVVFERRDA